MGFFRQEYWNGLPFPSPRDLPDWGIEPMYLALAGGFFTTEPPGKPNWSFTLPQKRSPSWSVRDFLELPQLQWGKLSCGPFPAPKGRWGNPSNKTLLSPKGDDLIWNNLFCLWLSCLAFRTLFTWQPPAPQSPSTCCVGTTWLMTHWTSQLDLQDLLSRLMWLSVLLQRGACTEPSSYVCYFYRFHRSVSFTS